MSVEAFLRQGFIPFRDAVGRETSVLGSAVSRLGDEAAQAARALGRPAHMTFAGIGASFAAVAAPAAFLSSHGIPSARLNAGEMVAPPIDGALVALSQSGRSRETVGLMRAAHGARLAVVNVSDSPMANAADAVLSLGDLPDSLASTIGYTASAIAVSMLAEAIALGMPARSWNDIGQRLDAFVALNDGTIDSFADAMLGATIIDFAAPHIFSGAAEGGSLLIREVARVPAAAFETHQYLHGHMESTNAETLHVVIEGPDSGEILKALTRHDRRIVAFGTSESEEVRPGVASVRLAAASTLEIPIFVAVFLQHAVLRVALARGIDPDEFLFLDTGTKLGDGE
jgi:glucosamine--fructose-6-phosphate aminotransferase (isomerizing)